MKNKTACFTGHRKIPPEQLSEIAQRLEKIIIGLIENGYCYFGAGGALGFDTLAALTVLQLKEKYTQVRLILVLPCLTQSKDWSEDNQIVYEEIKSKADKIVYTSKEYSRGCMHKRNRHLVDNSSACICYLTKQKGGTAYTVSYAQAKGVSIFNMAKK
jgi:uncharacterized phage-like protein YoqJ